MIVSNPPYISRGELSQLDSSVKEYVISISFYSISIEYFPLIFIHSYHNIICLYDVVSWVPHLALVGGDDGLVHYKAIAQMIKVIYKSAMKIKQNNETIILYFQSLSLLPYILTPLVYYSRRNPTFSRRMAFSCWRWDTTNRNKSRISSRIFVASFFNLIV